jgi:hypothetical protein
LPVRSAHRSNYGATGGEPPRATIAPLLGDGPCVFEHRFETNTEVNLTSTATRCGDRSVLSGVRALLAEGDEVIEDGRGRGGGKHQ